MDKKIMVIVMVIVLLAVLAGGWLWFFHFLAHASNPALPTQKLSIDGNTWTVEMATTTIQQALGLSGRESLGANDGMLFVFGGPGVQNFWMKDMNFSLDMIWISGNTVAGFAQDAAPQPGAPLWKLKIYTSPYNVDKVLEVVAGTVAKYNIKVGDVVTISP
jgi:hypothetical protein